MVCRSLASTTPDKHQTLQRRDPFARCIEINIQQVLANFNQKEIYIIEHLFNGRELSSEEIAANLKVTKVNITFTKTRIIRRHSSLSNKILNGI
jgi:DNA-directed RNA polymerase specialized sigma subunit